MGWWTPNGSAAQTGDEAIARALQRVGRPVQLVDVDGRLGAADGGVATLGSAVRPNPDAVRLVAYAPALLPEQLGDPEFCSAHGLRFAYVAGAMANGISSVEMVEAMARGGMVGFFGAAGLSLDRVQAAIDRIQGSVGAGPYGFNLIHTPNEPASEASVVELYLKRNVRLVSASAYLDLTLPLIRYRVTGVHRDADGAVVAPNKVIAKVSRAEVARKFFAPPPESQLETLVRHGFITDEQARLAREIPMAEDLTAEADSGGHTDNRAAMALLPTMLALAEESRSQYGYRKRLRVGAAGGIATPQAAAAALAMGASYVLTGTVNQACRESGTSKDVREMLARATQADVTMAPAADMFEMGVKVQVLKWGTMFAVRSRKLYELYRSCASLDKIPSKAKAMLERDFFRSTLPEAWAKTREFFAVRDPEQIARANRDPKHKMALVFRAYLGQSSDWANSGDRSRQADYQIWCGPAMGAFNDWVRGSFLERPERRDVVTVGMNLLVGAAVQMRANWLRAQGASLPLEAQRFAPRELPEMVRLFDDTEVRSD
jgi:trans-AT polyketide synthase, acyltransferase and oxidoreductase domains